MKKNESRAILKIHDLSLGIESVAPLIGITPTDQWKKGDLVYPNLLIKRKSNGFKFEFPLQDNDIELTIKKNILSLLKKVEKIKPYDNGIYVELAIVLYLKKRSEVPTFFIPALLLKKLADRNVNLDIDIITIA